MNRVAPSQAITTGLMMTRHHRLRSVLKWSSALIAVVIVGIWVASVWFVAVTYTGSSFMLGFAHGFCWFKQDAFLPRWVVQWAAADHKAAYGMFLPEVQRQNGILTVGVPLWIPFVCVAALTAIFFVKDRRRIPPGHCPACGYNLTGNVSGRCPECGAECRRDESAV